MVARVVDLRKGKQTASSRTRQLPLREPPPPPRRPSPLRTRRRRARAAVFGLILLGLAALAYGIHLVSYISPLSIERITVSGAEKIDPAIIETYIDSQLSDGSFHYFSRRNIFMYPKEVREAGVVTSFPRVKSARLSRDGIVSRDLLVAIEERMPYALWCRSEEDCYALDDTGFIFTASATSTHGEYESAYIFTGGVDGGPIGARFIPGQMPSILALLRVLQQETNLIPSRVDILADQDFNVTLEQGFFVKASFGQEPETLARNLDLVLSSEALRDRIADIEYIDLRFGNRVYYKMKGEEQTNI